MKNQKMKSSSKAVSAGVFIALYLLTYVVIGAICMPIPILFLLMPMLVAFFAAPTYHMLLAKSPSGLSIFIASVLPSLVLIATGHNPIAPLVSVPAGLLAVLLAKRGGYKDFRWNTWMIIPYIQRSRAANERRSTAHQPI